ncbi:MAG: class I adenylate-forming enzyme family protein [Actinobacteria bacterium]|nr:class I adenylate-forming enzyme family protein [Actinomycetota bacterium]
MYDFSVLEKWALEKPNEIAFVDEYSEVTFSRMRADVLKIASHLSQVGITRGDLVCTVLTPYFRWAFTLAIHLLGATAFSKNGITKFPAAITPKWMITNRAHPQISAERTIMFSQELVSKIMACQELEVIPGYASPDDPAILFGTSGTSGETKYVMVTAGDLERFPIQKSPYDFIGEGHIMGLHTVASRQSFRRAIKGLTVGKTFFACESMDYRLPHIMRKYSIGTLMGSPLQVSLFLDVQKQTGTLLPDLKVIIMSGSAPSAQIIARIKGALNCRIFNAYGSTEGGNVTLAEVTDEIPSGSYINASVIVQIVDENDQILPADTLGYIRYSREGMVKGYYKNPEATAASFRNGFFYPGDIGLIEGDGKLVLGGRSNEVINLGGVKINPEKVDEVARAQLGVLDCAAFGLTDQTGVEQLALALVTDKDFNLAIFQKTMEKKSAHLPKKYIQTDVIPRNENGKVLRGNLEELLKDAKGFGDSRDV